MFTPHLHRPPPATHGGLRALVSTAPSLAARQLPSEDVTVSTACPRVPCPALPHVLTWLQWLPVRSQEAGSGADAAGGGPPWLTARPQELEQQLMMEKRHYGKTLDFYRKLVQKEKRARGSARPPTRPPGRPGPAADPTLPQAPR